MEDLYFTSREKDIIYLIMKGMTNKEIGKKLFISTHTVKAIIEKIYEKTGCKNRVQLSIFILKNNIEIAPVLL